MVRKSPDHDDRGHRRRHHVLRRHRLYLLADVVQEFRFITPGFRDGDAVWLAAMYGFNQYATHFGHYNVMYGSIGGVIMLMTWLYLTGFVLLLGGEIDTIVEHHASDGKALGLRAPWEAPLRPSERPADGSLRPGGSPEPWRGTQSLHPGGLRIRTGALARRADVPLVPPVVAIPSRAPRHARAPCSAVAGGGTPAARCRRGTASPTDNQPFSPITPPIRGLFFPPFSHPAGVTGWTSRLRLVL